MGAAGALVGGLLTTSGAYAEPEDDSEALGEVLSSQVLGQQLLDAASSESGNPSDPGPNYNQLDIEALDALTIDLGDGLEIPLVSTPEGGGLLELGEVGALHSYAASESDTTSVASAGAVSEDGSIALDPENPGEYGPAKVNLIDLLRQLELDGVTDDVVDELELTLGAAASRAEADGADISSEYVLAGAELEISSPAVGDVGELIDTELTSVGEDLNAVLGSEGAIGQLIAGLQLEESIPNPVPGLPPIASIAVSGGTIGVDGLDTALDELSNTLINEPLEDPNGIVAINLADGTITIDLEKVAGEEGLNGLDPNTLLLDADTISKITTAVSEALGSVTTKVTEGLTEVLNNTSVKIDLAANLSLLGGDAADVTINVDTTLGWLAGTDDTEPTLDVEGDLLGIPVTGIVNAIAGPLEAALLELVRTEVSGLIDTIGEDLAETLTTDIDGVLDTLSPVLQALNSVVQVTINEQPTEQDPAADSHLGADGFTVTALSLELLPDSAAEVNLDLASSSVRALDESAADPGEDPGTDPGEDPGTDPGAEPGTDPGEDPGTDPGAEPGADPGEDPGTDPGAEPGADPGNDPGADPGADPGTDPGTDPGADPGADPGNDPGADPGADPGDDDDRAGGKLPTTGAELAGLIIPIGLLILAAGVGLVLWSRRKGLLGSE